MLRCCEALRMMPCAHSRRPRLSGGGWLRILKSGVVGPGGASLRHAARVDFDAADDMLLFRGWAEGKGVRMMVGYVLGTRAPFGCNLTLGKARVAPETPDTQLTPTHWVYVESSSPQPAKPSLTARPVCL